MSKVVIAGKYPAAGLQIMLDRCAGKYDVVCAQNEEELNRNLDGDYYVLRGLKMPAELIEKLQGTSLIHRWGVGYDSVDIEAAGKKGIKVAICLGVNAQPVAELAVTLMLASYRHLAELTARAQAGTKDVADIFSRSFLISGKRVGLVGLGNIGRRVAKAVQGFGAEVVYYDPFRIPEDAEKAIGVTYMSLEDVLKTSDIISLHVPLLDSTAHMINEQTIAMMKPNALLINTARGGIIDTPALLKALKEGRIFGAAVDTIEGEPLPAGHEAFSEPRLIITPHAGGNTEDNNSNMASYVMNNIDALEAGKDCAPRSVVNTQFLK